MAESRLIAKQLPRFVYLSWLINKYRRFEWRAS